jgi:hypothetical protein
VVAQRDRANGSKECVDLKEDEPVRDGGKNDDNRDEEDEQSGRRPPDLA